MNQQHRYIKKLTNYHRSLLSFILTLLSLRLFTKVSPIKLCVILVIADDTLTLCLRLGGQVCPSIESRHESIPLICVSTRGVQRIDSICINLANLACSQCESCLRHNLLSNCRPKLVARLIYFLLIIFFKITIEDVS